MRCPDPLCEGPSAECACALRATAQPLGTFQMARAYPSTWLGWLQCRWRHGTRWLWEHELPPYALTASLSATDMWCPVCELVR